ncbi:hypothetical protein YYG_02382 [Plasmodium vinckei petteri]|uniref:Heat shock protein 110, putative n=1 Tax=Plasmodium vinckei petteri TaxID=138298 RepID=W7B3J4_PLAVN|nr:hypothetical protein YYG_02382 [Plasmodium vinckei petteri]CAD2109626.1 heat shock protein 110, putative [Plasmodium vinckei petteri]
MSVLGIDIGNENSVVATINKGAINIVRNDISERLTPTLIGFTEKERLIGDNALAKVKSNFRNTCRNIKNVLGKVGAGLEQDDLELNEAYGDLVECEHGYLGYNVEYKKEKENISAVRIIATLLLFLIRMGEKYIGKECNELVLSYPPNYTNNQIQCLAAAAKIINVNILRLISDNTAVALDYGMYRMKEFNDKNGSIVAFVNIGYANTYVCIAKFYSNKCEILCDIADPTLGGRNIDNELIKYINNLFINTHKINALYSNGPIELSEMGNGKLNKTFTSKNNETAKINNKVRVKLQDVAIKTKKVLSANNETSIHVECLHEDLDCQGTINRETYEEICSNFFLTKLKNILDKAIAISKIDDVKNAQSVEILGGTTRIPFIQNFLQSYFNKPLSKTLVADESVARGCVLSAAMQSKYYKVKEYECIEKVHHPISVKWENMNDKSGASPKVEKLYTTDSIRRKVSKIVIPDKGNIKITAFYEDNTDLPENCVKELGSCVVKINEKNDKIVESHVMATFSNNDVFTFLGAQTVSKNVIKGKEEKDKASEEKSADDSKDKNNESPSKSEDKSQSPSSSPSKTELKKGEEGKIQTCYTTIPLEIISPPGTYTNKDIYNFSEAEINMQHSDTLEAERLKHINELETIIYETRDRMNGMYKDFVVDDERDSILLALDDVENWIYDNIDENKNAFVSKKEEIRARIKDIIYRHDVYASKQKNLGSIISHLKNIITQCEKHASDESQKIITKANNLLSTLDSLQDQEKNKKLYEPPVYTLKDIEKEFGDVTQMAQKYFSKIEAEELAKQKEKLEQEKKNEKNEEKQATEENEPTENNESEEKPEAGDK